MATHDETVEERYTRPSDDEIKVTIAWFVRQGNVDQRVIEKAIKEANREGKRDNLTFREALHKVTNRAARKNQKGWEWYNGDWVKFLETLKRYNL